jgi:hypothetical protein
MARNPGIERTADGHDERAGLAGRTQSAAPAGRPGSARGKLEPVGELGWLIW